MKKLMVYLDDDFHEDLKELAHRKRTSMAALVRFALDKTFEDELDVIAAEASLAEYLRDPSSAVSLADYLKERGIVLPGRDYAPGKKKPAALAERTGQTRFTGDPGSRRRADAARSKENRRSGSSAMASSRG